MKTTTTLALCVVTLLAACPAAKTEPVVEAAAVVLQSQPAQAMPVAAPGAGKVESDCAHHDTALTNDKVTTRTNEKGQTITHAGAEFGEVAVVSVVELLDKPDAFMGKTVRVKGSVGTMCTHRRGWFSVVADDQSGRFVRVITTPSFLVPAGSIGKTAEAEGTVEVLEVAADHAKHLAGQHKMGDPEQITANVKQVVIRATGADFI